MPSLDRKRGREGGQDGARPNKKTSIGASASASSSGSNPASVAVAAADNSDPDILITPYDGHRRAHRKLLLYDEVRRGFFWAIGERKTPDKDGRFRSIVVKRGYFEPDNKRKPDDVRQPPEDWESEVNPTAVKDIKPPNLWQPAAAPAAAPTAPSLTTSAAASASRPFATPAAARPLPAPAASPAAPPAIQRTAPSAGLAGHPTGNTIHEVIDISSDEEDVKPSLAELQRNSNSANSGPQRVEAQREAQSSGGNEADTQGDPFQNDPFQFDDPVEPVHDRNGSIQEPVNRQRQIPEAMASISEQPPQPQSLDIWTYITQFARTPAPRPDDEAITELLKLPRRRDIPVGWRRRLCVFNTLSLHQLTAFI
ncbi:hypothetical protein N0V85_006798 [Neurospora sp. IMI 360204]|nr:hypothetical protein N0V85_006798 [Neurospora sp. IMI 360204]